MQQQELLQEQKKTNVEAGKLALLAKLAESSKLRQDANLAKEKDKAIEEVAASVKAGVKQEIAGVAERKAKETAKSAAAAADTAAKATKGNAATLKKNRLQIMGKVGPRAQQKATKEEKTLASKVSRDAKKVVRKQKRLDQTTQAEQLAKIVEKRSKSVLKKTGDLQ